MSNAACCLNGEWTIHQIAQHREDLRKLVEDGHTSFDASGVSELDSAGLQLLLAAQRSIARRGGEMHLSDLSAVLKDVLSIYGLDHTLHAVHTEESAS